MTTGAAPGALRRLKLAAVDALDSAGLFSVASRTAWRSRRLLILCYHGVSLRDEHECSDEHISAEHLRRRFEILREQSCTVLPLGEAYERMMRDDLPARSVALTFDDGLFDFKARAYPLLQEFAYPATVYVATYYCLHPLPVFDVAAAYLMWKGRGRPITTDLADHLGDISTVPENPGERARLLGRLREGVRGTFSSEDKNALLRRLCVAIGVDWEEFIASRIDQLMTPSELRSLDSALVDVQLHTHRHRTPRDESLFLRELDDNLAALEQIGLPRAGSRHFCYPSGDVDLRFLPWLRSRGIITATTCEPGLADSGSDPLLLPRIIDTMSMTESEFRGWLSGMASFLPRRG